MVRLVTYLLLAITTGAASFFIGNSTVVSMTTGFAIGMLIPAMDEIGKNWNHLRHIWYSLRYRNQSIRVSTSYLFRIFIDGKYLLIRGKRYPTQFQPVGGVHKVSHQGSSSLAAMGVTGDDLIPIDPESDGDIRVRVPGRNIVSFFNWFDSREGREDSPWREFQEELIASNVLPAADFPHIMHNYIRRDVDKIRYSAYADSLEVLVADIYELIPNRAQEDALRQLMSQGHPDIQWVAAQQIRRRGAVPGQPQSVEIAAHAQRVL
ncbi:hypothetical protein [Kitasatospora purpeofusca]|uniref:SMODS-associated NUDIX domain-containing protein n=1 Tax=Kitasatospora purpeofusca TaxID=67352 RepID=UPI002A5B0525|nr:hypothetical protein [Kitasatospora purpeofusca]MDY0815108.1 hypothetical protein [Kitasatospora purpeofusca]